jgi:hypothetical protein
MAAEFDEATIPVRWFPGSSGAASARVWTQVRVARLVSRLYKSADQSLRAKLLACLLRPLSPLGLVAVAAGAFDGFLGRSGSEGSVGAIDDVVQYSIQQIFELASFVEQSRPCATSHAGRG